MTSALPDIVTLELVQEYLISTVREMRVTMIRTAHSSVIYEGHDFSCALLDAEGNLVAQSEDSPAHVIPLNWQVRQARSSFEGTLREGDIILVNDPYTSGTHLNDVAMIAPFFTGDRLSAFSVVRAHWGDVGGMTPGSISGQASEIFQEGLRIPFVKVYEAGRPVDALLQLIFANVRVPEEREGDFHAMLACCNTGLRGLAELTQRFGRDGVTRSISALLARSEARMRQAIRSIPPGTYCYEDYLDCDNRFDRPVLLTARIECHDDTLDIDFAGTASQVPAPINASLAVTAIGVFVALKALLDPEGPINQGIFRPVSVRAPKGTILNVEPPGAVGGFSEIRRRVESTIMGALAVAVPKYIAGDVKGTANHIYIGSTSATGRSTIFYEYPAGGTGGFRENDGNHALRAYDDGDFASIQPVEAVEIEHPLRVEACRLRADSCGDGLHRGGLGLQREVRVIADEARLSVLSDRNIVPPYGVCGGRSGAPNRFSVRRDGRLIAPSKVPGKVSGFPLQKNDVVIMESSGGGGYGDSLDREPERVAADVASGIISAARAHDVYGVVLHEAQLDGSATAFRRDRLRRERFRLSVVAQDVDGFGNGGRLCALAPQDAAELGEDGTLIEVVNDRGAPLRAWLSRQEITPGTIALGPIARLILGVHEGDQLEIRRL